MKERPTVEVLEAFWDELPNLLPNDRDQAEIDGTVRCLARGFPEQWDLVKFEEQDLWHLDLEGCLSSPHRILMGQGQKGGRDYLLVITVIPMPPRDTPVDHRRAAERVWREWDPCGA